jgi:FdhD protein
MEPNDISALVIGPAGRSLAQVAGAPRLSAARAVPVREIPAVDEQGIARTLHVPIERPLTLVVDGLEIVTLMTLGAAPEWLVIGYLRNHRLIGGVETVRAVEVDWTRDVAVVTTRNGAVGAPPATRDNPATAPLGCALGTAFLDVMHRFDAGTAGSAVTAHPTSHATLLDIIESMRHHDAIHRAAGSVHSCALFRGGELWVAVEDVSRHNGVDMVTGFMSLHGVAGADKILFTTGRLTGEMVMKAAHNGISVMISRNGTTAMGYDLGLKLGMTLIGRAGNRGYVCYTGADRIVRDAPS